MKKVMQKFAVIIAAGLLFGFSACSNGAEHEHTFESGWKCDQTYHWHICDDCEEICDKAEHSFGEWKTIVNATETTDGSKERTCTVCGYKESGVIEKHTFVFDSFSATLFEEGKIIYKCACGETKEEDIGPLYSVPSDEKGFPLKAIPEDKIVYFGIMPRTVAKQNGSIIYGKDGTTVITIEETAANSKTMGSNTYYKGSDGEYYQKVTELLNEFNDKTSTEYDVNKNKGNITNDDSLTYSDGSEVRKSDEDNTYTRWFRVEPIKWKIITTNYSLDYTNASSKKACLLLAEEMITSNVPYFEKKDRRNGSEFEVNNYKHSQIRAYLNGINYESYAPEDENIWLNKGFLQTAFFKNGQDIINTTKVNNTAETTSYSSEFYAYDYVCEATDDKVFLLSQSEVVKSEYGFPAYDSFGVGNARIRKATDYAKANNCYQSTTPGYGGCWWLRSPIQSRVIYISSGVHHHGEADNCSNYVNRKYGGIVPAITVSFGE